MLESIAYQGPYITDLDIPGCSKADDLLPSHPKIIHLSRSRFLVVLGTRGFRGVDDDRDIVYQVRRDSPYGAILNQGVLARSQAGWDPLARGDSFLKSNGTPVAFGGRR